MNREEIIRSLRGHRANLRQFRVASLAVLGSAARDCLRPDSDIDIVVAFEGPATFDRYTDLKFFLKALLGRPVDLAAWKSLRPRVRPRVELKAIRVA